MYTKIPLSELQGRLSRFKKRMDQKEPDWQIAVIFSKVNQYYFTGTMQDGMLIIPRDSEAVYYIRRSYERAIIESQFENIKPMQSYREAAADFDNLPDTVYIETEVVPLALLQRFQKYFPFNTVKSCDMYISSVRSVKSGFELALLKEAGRKHGNTLENFVPGILKEGMNEAELAAIIYSKMIEEGHHGLVRFQMFDTEMLLGHVGFGESSIYPSYFNGPSGILGISPAAPLLGSRERKLRKGDLVYIDIGFNLDGYQTDKALTYVFGSPLPDSVRREHDKCVDIQDRIAEMMKPGISPAVIYKEIMSGISEDFNKNFMGYGKHKVKFLGHGIGLQIDEMPVIAEGFDEPLQEGMTFALEPKKGIEGVGMVGIENTFVVTGEGGLCITGSSTGLVPVY